jgi:iron(III) transport system substrate-binding protein
VTIDHIDATADKLLARIVAEARGGRVLADVFGGALPYMAQASGQKLLAPVDNTRGFGLPGPDEKRRLDRYRYPVYIAGWNTNLVKKDDEPKNFEDLANPKWQNALMGEPRDFQLLIGLAKRKYNNDEKAIDLLKKIAATQVEFHKDHSQLVEFLVPNVEPLEKVRPTAAYMLTIDDIKEFPKYEKLCKDIFQIR